MPVEGGDLLEAWVGPAGLEFGASVGVVVWVMAGRADGDSLNEAPFDRRVELFPSRCCRPAVVAWEAAALRVARSRTAQSRREAHESQRKPHLAGWPRANFAVGSF